MDQRRQKIYNFMKAKRFSCRMTCFYCSIMAAGLVYGALVLGAGGAIALLAGIYIGYCAVVDMFEAKRLSLCMKRMELR